MNNRLIIMLFFSLFIIFITACDSDNVEIDTQQEDSKISNEMTTESSDFDHAEEEQATEDAENIPDGTSDQMVIHQAYLTVQVKDLEKTQLQIDKKVSEYDGYTVESNVYQEDEEHSSGYVKVRIPEKHFQSFLKDTQSEVENTIERTITGQDITEQYVDLKSRRAAKESVEERLLDFMEEADKTEDLLKISNDLSEVQEEIEVIVGQINYLDNQVDFATVEITMQETSVIIPDMDNSNLDTWDKTKKQFATSINFIRTIISGCIVFFVGNLPMIIILLSISIGAYLIIRNKKK
ncbi:MAG TPA: DUF4349 domain-containing protein [Virgibacillus sp.]|nr:DUF4349 domain-containing protein [Virgibacillus sp.]